MGKKVLIILTAFLLLGVLAYASLVMASNNNSKSAIGASNNSDDEEDEHATIGTQNENEEELGNEYGNITRERNRLRIHANASEVPANCTKTGSALKCNIDGGRQMTIFAGNSGNVIIQNKNVNASTTVELFNHNGKVYMNKSGNQTKKVNYMPDQVQERVRERTKAKLNNTNITLNENGEYKYSAEKEARFLWLFKTREKVSWNIDAETGEILKEHAPWWGFLANDVEDKTLLGESCGTVTPGYNDECCQNKGYSSWNVEQEICV